MRIVLDTNVIVSALIQKSYPFFIVDRILAEINLELCISETLFAEYIEVLNRSKFSRFTDFQKQLFIAKNRFALTNFEHRYHTQK